MHPIDYGIIVLYLAVLLFIGLRRSLRKDTTASELILGGRLLTLPAFVASLVSTWYGGILGVGEYSYRYGLSNWLVFGVPYYLAAALFAIFLARKARESLVLTIPDRLAQVYDNKTAIAGAVIIYLMTVPAAYILMCGVLCQYLFGWPFWVGVIAGTFFSVVYVYTGGFFSMVRTDGLQFVVMFLGFIILLPIAVAQYGGWSFLQTAAPPEHFTWHGGNTPLYIALWYFIALATLIEPTFFQRCYAARNPAIARRGIFISIGCWAFFDFLTTTTGIYARAILPNLSDPVASYPALAVHLLPAGLLGIFALALLATVTSTVDSYSFIAATTFGNDIVGRAAKLSDRGVLRHTRLGLLVSASLAILISVFFRSVVDIWHAFGSVGTPALLVPVFTSFVGRRRLPSRWALLSIISCGSLSALWLASKYFHPGGAYWLGIQPIFPGLILSLILFVFFSKQRTDGPLQPTPKKRIMGHMSEPMYMSKEGVRKLEAELKRLKFEERPKIVADIKRAREHGDLSENAEYHAAKEAQGHLERKISELELKLSRVHTIDTDAIPTDKVYLYAKVCVEDLTDGERIDFTIVPPSEADVDNDIISIESPIGKGLLGKAEGETAEITVPAGTLRYKVIKISRE